MDNSRYNKEFYAGQKDKSYYTAKQVLPIIFENVHVDSVVDFGCGTGSWLKAAEELGANSILGVDFGNSQEYLFIRPEQLMKRDLTQPIQLEHQYDLVISVEVAEHLPPDSAETFIETLCNHGKVVLFSAAIVGQGGDGHLNEQFLSYWKRLFEKREYVMLDFIRFKIWDREDIPFWYRQNLVMFVSKSVPFLKMLTDVHGGATDIVHPRTLINVLQLNAYMRSILIEKNMIQE